MVVKVELKVRLQEQHLTFSSEELDDPAGPECDGP